NFLREKHINKGGDPTMKKQLVYPFVFVLAAVLMAAQVQAGESTDSISIKFGANEPAPGGSALAPTAVAGLPGFESANWNNASGASSSLTNLVRDTFGSASTTNASVIWSATNTWSSGGFNFTGNDKTLMNGYLDQNTEPALIRIQISNL